MNNMNNLHSTRDHYEQIEAHFKAKGKLLNYRPLLTLFAFIFDFMFFPPFFNVIFAICFPTIVWLKHLLMQPLNVKKGLTIKTKPESCFCMS